MPTGLVRRIPSVRNNTHNTHSARVLRECASYVTLCCYANVITTHVRVTRITPRRIPSVRDTHDTHTPGSQFTKEKNHAAHYPPTKKGVAFLRLRASLRRARTPRGEGKLYPSTTRAVSL